MTITAKSASEAAIHRLSSGQSLSRAEARALFHQLVTGALDEDEIVELLTSLRTKGETGEELIGAAHALRAADVHFERPNYLFADTCGTGGDGAGTINISTAVAFIAAAAGLPVAKHGNRSVTSRCGSADVLEALGAKLDLSASVSRRLLDETGFCFLLAPLYHPGLRHAAAARRRIAARTAMNLLGPCLNPAEPPVQLLGVADAALLEPIADTLAALGTEAALIVHGAGLDEVALHGATEAILLRNGERTRLTMTPQEAGLSPQPLDALKGGDPAENAARLKDLLGGGGRPAERDAAALNAGALLLIAGLVSDLREGTTLARQTLASGAPLKVLRAYVEASHG